MSRITSIVVGVDPGLTGAIAVLVNGAFHTLHDMPIEARPSKGNQIACGSLVKIAAGISDIDRACTEVMVAVEQVSAMPGQGVSSMFSFGQSFGAARMFGYLVAHARVEMVSPSDWKKMLHITKTRKSFALTLARQQFPGARDLLAREKDVGRADALLIAHYAYRHLF